MKEIMPLFFYGVVVLFTVASTILAGYSLQNKFRLRNVRLNWRAGKLNGYPLFATFFLVLMSLLSAVVLSTGDTGDYKLLGAYMWIGCMWFISSYLASKHYITDHGIVKNINEPSQTIPWFQILDMVEHEEVNGSSFVFTYSEMNSSLVSGYNRLKVHVPAHKRNSFQKLVSLKLKTRLEGEALPDIDLKKIQEE